MAESPAVVLDAAAIRGIVERLAEEIARDHPGGVVLVGVLRGALIFLADLARAIRSVPVEIDFLAVSRFAPGSGRARLLHDLTIDIGDRDVVLVEDIVDTGLTLAYLTAQLSARGPSRLETCTLLDRPARRIVPHDVRYRGAEVGDEYLLGYGLHHRDLYRNLPYLARVDRVALAEAPARYTPALYGPEVAAAEAGARVPQGGTEPP